MNQPNTSNESLIMFYALIALVFSLIVTAGRIFAICSSTKCFLWFLSYSEIKRSIFVLLSLFFSLISFLSFPIDLTCSLLLIFNLLLCSFHYFVCTSALYPEYDQVTTQLAKDSHTLAYRTVIGISMGHSKRAYPLHNMQQKYFIVMDKVANKHVLITYCKLCQCAWAYSTMIDGRSLYFKPAGTWRKNMVMYDVETNSLWQQATGKCIRGYFAGRQLEPIYSELTNWCEWKKNHPKTVIVSEYHSSRRSYLDFAMIKKTKAVWEKLGKSIAKKKYRSAYTVFGIVYNGISRAYPLSDLGQIQITEDQYGDKVLLLEFNKNKDHLLAIEKGSNKKVIVTKYNWTGWKEFHPETEIWRPSA